ncbi:MAG: sarcosine oxidase subunit delta [Hyphomicrobium sp.]|nr:sarcosine oxidase subunit delta [Hyphomicrobium sp.]
MKIMNCPLNGPRNISEFVCQGDVKDMPDPATATDVEWTAYLFLEENLAGEVVEWWLHTPTNYWFIARRNTITDEILETMTVDAYFARKSTAATSAPPGATGASA